MTEREKLIDLLQNVPAKYHYKEREEDEAGNVNH